MEAQGYGDCNGTRELPQHLRKFIPEIIALLAAQGTVVKIWRQRSRLKANSCMSPVTRRPGLIGPMWRRGTRVLSL